MIKLLHRDYFTAIEPTSKRLLKEDSKEVVSVITPKQFDPALQGLKTFAVACCGLGPHFLQWIIYQS